ncbi:MAG: tRNA (cytidine(34)-2'-O)-methyltransferase [Candidatus Cloacimonetes bacterium]|nr:tRNA (cytidine(34)-2'-O)-methyltransferase [Candidatus Cloacimonadota bacterium]MCF7813950.1 tRNA (cytidine(34)-2'-O)-methyltransferase [Candidatus Cloacimonadota bacterium]MCF7868044.1 tRNA (cytidine(34)-2'-O)-methyltransferase [Candidatus Cloacimonadota bacterium]MCF7883964.1 tRNA (cytidine(34)-2'-O)-methyltransferase [Candidatus Cloacimonadota bacterium]
MAAKTNFKIVLYEPEIPGNTGNIGRLCLGMNAELHLIKPMKFLITDKHLKRAGLDYWHKLKYEVHENLEAFLNKNPNSRMFWCTTKSDNLFTDVDYRKGDIFIFGPESRGIPEAILHKHWQNTIKIPMTDKIRSLNLSNSVAVIMYEAWKQIGFELE